MARPRTVEPGPALEALTALFWERGFDGAPMQAVEAATGLKKPSLYRLFGNKRAMYLRALGHYEETVLAESLALLAGPGDARARIGRLFQAAIDGRDRRGCFLCNASIDRVRSDLDAQAAVAGMTARLRAAIEAALAASPPYDTDPERRRSIAALLLAAYFGLRVMIRAGLPGPALRAAADAALDAI